MHSAVSKERALKRPAPAPLAIAPPPTRQHQTPSTSQVAQCEERALSCIISARENCIGHLQAAIELRQAREAALQSSILDVESRLSTSNRWSSDAGCQLCAGRDRGASRPPVCCGRPATPRRRIPSLLSSNSTRKKRWSCSPSMKPASSIAVKAPLSSKENFAKVK